jgi:hypothetical protein
MMHTPVLEATFTGAALSAGIHLLSSHLTLRRDSDAIFG